MLGLLLALAMLAGCAAAKEAAAPAIQKDLIVLYTSDVHCGIDQNRGHDKPCGQERIVSVK